MHSEKSLENTEPQKSFNFLMEHEAKALLEKYGIKTARCVFVRSEEELLQALKEIGFPAVLKIASRRISHKSEVGGVRFVYSEEDAIKNFRELTSIRFVEGVNVQPMLERGLELFLGVAEDPQFGIFLALGLGGVYFEALKDYSVRLIPVNKEDVEEMIKELRSRDAFSHRKNLDREAIVELALKISKIAEKESILEMDLNPVFVYEKGCVVADARIVIGKRKSFKGKIKEPIFNPKKIAIVGASNNPLKVGYAVLQSLKASKAEIYPVNPNLSEIDGIKVLNSLEELPEVDLAIIALPAEKVVENVEKLIGKAKEALIISAGFKESETEEGKERERRLRELSERIRIIGPNVFGFVNVLENLNASFTPEFSNLKPGKIALVSQSGGICHYVLHRFKEVGFSYIIHLGNRCDIDFPETLEFLAKDENTKVVAIYVEGIENGRAFFDSLKKISDSGKIPVVLKAGKSEIADKASLSHTGSLAGNYKIFTSAVKQAKGIVVESPTELIDVATIAERFGRIRSVAIATIQAGLGIVFADILESNGGKLSKLSEKTLEELRKILPPITHRDNPVDVSFTGLDALKLKKILELLREDENVSAVVFCYAVAPPSWVIPDEIMKELFRDEIVVYVTNPKDFEKKKSELSCILFDSIERCALAIARLSHGFH